MPVVFRALVVQAHVTRHLFIAGGAAVHSTFPSSTVKSILRIFLLRRMATDAMLDAVLC